MFKSYGLLDISLSKEEVESFISEMVFQKVSELPSHLVCRSANCWGRWWWNCSPKVRGMNVGVWTGTADDKLRADGLLA